MRTQTTPIRGRLSDLAVLAILPWLVSGCSSLDGPCPGEHRTAGPDRGEVHRCHHRDGHAAAHESPHAGYAQVLSLPLEQVAARNCEHGTLAYECDACRYEVGVVKVPETLWNRDGGRGAGLLRTGRAQTRAVSHDILLSGEIRWNDNAVVRLSPRVPGVVESVQADVGDRVRTGDPLFVLDSVELVQALGEYERTQALAGLSRKSLEREAALFQRRISSEQDLIEAQMVHEQHRTERKAAEHALRVLGVDGEDRSRSPQAAASGRLTVRAPRDATVIERHLVAGQRIEPGDDAMLLADLSTLWVWSDLYEPDLGRLLDAERQGPLPAEVFVRAFPGRLFRARVDSVGSVMDPRTRTVKVRAEVENTDERLRPGMFCEMRVALPGREEVLAVPRDALLADEGEHFVFVHWKEEYFVGRSVRPGRSFADQVEILEGLAPGDRIVIEGAFLLKSDLLREKMGAGCAD